MTKRTPLYLAVATMVVSVAAPAAACDMHGPGQMGGFHRFNPFASAMQGFPDLPKTNQDDGQSQDKSPAAAKKSKKAQKEAKRRQKALEETPKREWERDYGNGAITEADKATFT